MARVVLIDGILSDGYRTVRRIAILVIGTTLLLLGVALVFLPGPALIVLPVGLAVLAIEFAWARNWLSRVRRAISNHQRQSISRS